MELTTIDHVLAAILIVAMPLYALWEFRRLLAQLKAGVGGARMSGYKMTMAVEWCLSSAIVVLWLLAGRELPALGLGLKASLGWWIGLGLCLAACALLVMQALSAVRDPESMVKVRRQFGRLEPMLPRGASEARAFNALSITAGICEEILYRGYLIAYLKTAIGIWPAVFLSSVVFGLGHSYQGGTGVIKTGLVGLVMAGLYLVSGSLLAPMLLHAVLDLASGYIGRRAIAVNT